MEPLWNTTSFDMFGALAGVLLLIVAAAWLMRRLQNTHSAGKQHLRVVSILSLGTKDRVVLIQAGAEQLLMGVSAAGIQHLHTMKEPIQESVANDQAAKPVAASFATNLRTMMSKGSS